MASPTHWTRVWANSWRWWRTGKPGVLQTMGSRRVRHNWASEQQQISFMLSLTSFSLSHHMKHSGLFLLLKHTPKSLCSWCVLHLRSLHGCLIISRGHLPESITKGSLTPYNLCPITLFYFLCISHHCLSLWIYSMSLTTRGFLGGTGGKEPTCQCKRHKKHKFNPWVRRSPGGELGNPLQYSCLEIPMDRGDWQAMVHRVVWLERLSMSAHSSTRI